MDVDNIPHETLVILLQKKEKENKQLQSKLTKIEDRFIKITRFNKILQEDRRSFLSFCSETVEDAEAIFESAAAQEQPVDNRILGSRTVHSEKMLQAFLQLIFPNDNEITNLFESSDVDFELLRQKWMSFEDRNSEAMLSVSAAARDAIEVYERKLNGLASDNESLAQQLEENQIKIQQYELEKAQWLTSKLTGGGGQVHGMSNGHSSPEQKTPSSSPKSSDPETVVANNYSTAERDALTSRVDILTEELEKAQQEVDEIEQRRQSDIQKESTKLESVKKEFTAHKDQMRNLVDSKDKNIQSLREKLDQVMAEKDSNAFIEELASKQAQRDLDIAKYQSQADALLRRTAESDERRGAIEEEIDRLQRQIKDSTTSDKDANQKYVKHVILKYMMYVKRRDEKASTLIPVIATALKLTDAEQSELQEDHGLLSSVTSYFLSDQRQQSMTNQPSFESISPMKTPKADKESVVEDSPEVTAPAEDEPAREAPLPPLPPPPPTERP